MKTLLLIITLLSMTNLFAFEDMADCGSGSQEAQKQAIVISSPDSGAIGSGI